MFAAMVLVTTGQSSMGEINLVSKKDGVCGAIFVFETEKKAKKMYPDAEIVELKIKEQ